MRMAGFARRGVTPRARWLDFVGARIIAIGGIGVIAAVLGIFIFIFRESYPLFQNPEVQEKYRLQLPVEAEFLAAGLDPHQEVVFVVGGHGIDFLRPDSGELLFRERPAELQGRRIVSSFSSPANGSLALGLDDGAVLLGAVDFTIDYPAGQRRITPLFHLDGRINLHSEAIERLVVSRGGDGRSTVAALTSSGHLLAGIREMRTGLTGRAEVFERVHHLGDELKGKPTALLMDGEARQLLVGSASGRIYEWQLGGLLGEPRFVRSFAGADEGSAITALAFVLGDLSMVVGDESGGISTWFRTENKGERMFRRIHLLRSHQAAVTRIVPSLRDKQFLSGDSRGTLALHHMTSEQTFFQIASGAGQLAALSFAPKANGFLALGTGGSLVHYGLDNPHPEITLKTLFGKVWYEGYGKAAYVWQSTGGTDEFEPKLSLVPLIFGTAKGTFYAMLFALPLSVLAAIYTAEFARPRLRSLVKPTVEVMASLPTVILGFLGGLWLAPLLQRELAGTLLLFPLVPLVILAAASTWYFLSGTFRLRSTSRFEIIAVVTLTLCASCLAFFLGPAAENWVFGGSLLEWINQKTNLDYDQRNSLVVGFAMGVAVIPLVFTVSEDALSGVPQHLRAGSLALGATRWQTALRVVLPMAVPGIFSAAMIGFGRAVGETMIVLMATGNTPIMEWNIFNGMRTIAANIAVELPEAPQHGSLYRVLFLSGLLLFVVTFAVNSLAEIVRQHLREKYARL